MKRALTGKQVDTLTSLLGKSSVLLDEASRVQYGSDWTQLAAPDPVAVVFPQDTEQVQAIVQLANEWRWPLVPSGGRTGLAGAAVAANGEIVVSFEKMNRIIEVDTAERLLICEPGVVTAQVQHMAREHGLYYPVEFGADGSSQIGGNVATNAGGVRVLRYGMTRAQVAGLQVVTGTAAVIDEMRCLRKDNAGYALRELFIGSEGTLGMTTLAGLRLCEAPPALATALIVLDDIHALPGIMSALRAFELYACEWMDRNAFALGNSALEKPVSVPSSAGYVLLEAPVDGMSAEALSPALKQQCVNDVLYAQNTQQAEQLWRIRESITGALKSRNPLKCDVGFRVSALPIVMQSIEQQWPDAVVYGHIDDGNLHLNLVDVTDREQAQTDVWGLVQRFNGTITAEHGIGLLRREAFQSIESVGGLSAMRALKSMFDPHAILNPGKLLV